MGILALSKIQLGAESPAGTGAAATAVWRGKGTLQPMPTIELAEEDVGNLMGYDRTFIPYDEAKIALSEVPLTYEQLYVFEAGIESETPSQDGAGSDYIYTYNFPTTAARTHRTYTIEGGDNQQEREATYCFVTKFTLSGEAKKAVMISSEWTGRQSAKSTFTSLTPATVETVLFQMGKLYINAVSTYPATSQYSATWKKFNLEVTTGFTAQAYGDGRIDFTNTKQIQPEVVLQLTLEHGTNATAEIDAMIAQTSRAIRLDFTGGAVTTPGTTYSTKRFIIDLLGRYTESSPFEDLDGDTVITATLRARFNSTANSSGRIIAVNELSALT